MAEVSAESGLLRQYMPRKLQRTKRSPSRRGREGEKKKGGVFCLVQGKR
jgi:hypothetical protein